MPRSISSTWIPEKNQPILRDEVVLETAVGSVKSFIVEIKEELLLCGFSFYVLKIIDSEKTLWYTDVSTKIEQSFPVQNRSGRRGSSKSNFGGVEIWSV